MPDLLGSIIGGVFNRDSQQSANRTNIKLSREQRAWEERMSNTAVRRYADDIEAAGGNRALAFVHGGQSSTPSVSAPQVEATKYDSPDMNSAVLLKAQLNKLRADTDLTTEQQDVARATADNIRQNTATGANTAANLEQHTRNLEQALENLRQDLKGKITANEIAEIEKNVKGKTADEAIATAAENLRKAKAEATSAEKKALLDEALIKFIENVESRVKKYFAPQMSTGQKFQKGTLRNAPKKHPRSNRYNTRP